MKKIMTVVEVELIRLDANDMICTSQLGILDGEVDDSELFQAPTRYNYRGAAIDWDDQDW